jgi:pimeloyl-ACP methyl ester carboxylesterase
MAGLEHAFALIAPDLPGFGQTPPPPVAWSVSDYTTWLVHVLDGLAIQRAHIVGHSFGGRIAIKLASACPERVEKLVLTDSAGIRPRRTLQYCFRVRTFKTIRWISHAAIAPGPVRTWAATRVATSGSSDYQQASGTVRASFVRIVNEDLQSHLPRIQAPTLLVWGEHDTDTPPADGKLMERLIPDAGLVIFEGAGHYAYLEQSARFCRILETFFRGTSV